MKSFSGNLIEFFIVLGLSLASATLMAVIFIGVLISKAEATPDRIDRAAMEYRSQQ